MNINMKMDLSFARLCRMIASVAFLSLIGCGKSESVPDAQNQGTTGEVAPSGTASSSAVASSTSGAAKEKRKRDEVWTDEKGQKWFGNVPMDAFFDQPYTVASDSTPIGGNAVVADAGSSGVAAEMPPAIPTQSNGETAANNTAPTEAPMSSALPPETPAPTTPGGDEWSGLMPISMLEEEAKSIRGFLRENLQSVGNYNSSMLMIPPKAATLAVLAGIAMEHPEKVAWKDDAKYVRDLAKQMNASALQRGAKDQKRLSELFDALSSTMDRSKPAGLQEPAESDGFAETAPMNLLMNRMDECEKRLKTEAGTEASLTSRKDMALLEASILGSIAKVITKPGYGYEDDDEFKGFANEVVASTLAMKTAAESGDFSGFEAAMSKVSTTCNNCHGKYRSE